MSQPLFKRTRNNNQGTRIQSTHLHLPKVLEAEYYQLRADEAEARRAKRHSPKTKHQERRMRIAEDLREGLSDEIVMKKWSASRTLLLDVWADIKVGRI